MDKVKQTDAQDKFVFKGNYFYGTGRRKNSVARVRVYSDKSSKSAIVVNGKQYKDYFPTLELSRTVEDCFRVVNIKDKAVSALIKGGGKKGQAEALRHGIARALVAMDDNFKATLRENGFLTRDPRVKERKKPGLKKARRAPQWQKR